MVLRTAATALLFILAAMVAPPVRAETTPVQTAWRLLDYLAVDYRGAVKDGAVASESEYAEMVEFSAAARERIDALPPSAGLADLQRGAADLQAAIAAKASPDDVAATARGLAAGLLKAYPVAIAPTAPPSLERGRALYAEHCASCHGATGAGDGPAAIAAKLDPPPVAFTDGERARERSIFAYVQVLEQGLDGTSMASFADLLPPQDRWAVAAYAASLAFPEGADKAGERLWTADAALRAATNLERLMSLRPAELEAAHGEADGRALAAFLRNHPDATAPAPAGSLSLARGRLDEALAAYRRGDRKAATDLALSAYLDGFEPVEPVLAARDNVLMVRIESAMGALRAGIARDAPVEEVAGQVRSLDGAFAAAERILAEGESSAVSSFLAAFTILLREGLEALLIVVAMIAFLGKAERRDLVPWIHAGWVGALVAGAATWAVATWLIGISGASRELTEGFGSLVAAVVLIWVGIWMHGKSQADAWQHYVRDTLGRVLTRRSAWFLFGLAFVVVYREVFETILFYAAIWSQGQGHAVLGGAGAAVASLAVLAALMMRYSRRLPIGRFFGYSSALMAVLAVVLIGKAAAALQESGFLPVLPLSGAPRIELLGLYPTREGLLAQVVVAGLLIAGFVLNGRRAAARA